MRHVVALIGLILVTTPAGAHEVRPGYLELTQTAPDTFDAVWKLPSRGELQLALSPIFPERCVPASEITRVRPPGAVVDRWTLTCDGGLKGELRIAGLQATLTDVMIRIQWAGGDTQTVLLQSTSPSVVIGGGDQSATPVWGYLRLGVEHILLGIDHLLFVLGLLLIVKNRWMLIKTVTSFTVAHSITLGIATLGYASAPLPPLNAAIALSILFLGPEIVRSWRGQTSFTIRHPWVVAFAFGLLHGFGFASGLTTLGLPTSEIPVALLLFNVGVELGQIGFVLLILALERSFDMLEIRWPRWVEAVPGYTVGCLGAYWTIQRTAMLFGEFQ
jgi:hydrogenase/urease accessory protein HupE